MESEKHVEVYVLLEFSDFLRASFARLLRKNRIFLLVLAGLGGVLPMLCYRGAIPWIPIGSVANGFSLAAPAAALLSLLITLLVKAKRRMAGNPATRQTVRYSLSQDGIDAAVDSSTGSNEWSEVREGIETRRMFLLLASNKQMYIFPKRCFTEPQQVDSFKAAVRAGLGAKARF